MHELAATSPAAAPPTSARGSVFVRALVDLAKPGITRMVLITTALGALAAPTPITLDRFIPLVLGTGFVVAGANALNMFLERDTDALMKRTRSRPLPEGRISPDGALAFGVGVALAGLICLAHFTSLIAFGLAALALLLYVLVYTPLKRVGPVALYVGAVPGALPPVIGYAGNQGDLDLRAFCIFAILFVWQLPHFLAITLFREEEYARAGLRVLPVVRGRKHTGHLLFALSVALLLVTLLPAVLGHAGWSYGLLALTSGLAFSFAASAALRREMDSAAARKLFFFSMPHLVLVLSALVVSFVFP